MEQAVYVTMEKELDEPFMVKRDGREICIYMNVEAEYRVVFDEDVETGQQYADNITEQGVCYYISGCCDNGSGVELPVDNIKDDLTEEELEAMQSFAEMNSGFDDEEIEFKAQQELA